MAYCLCRHKFPPFIKRRSQHRRLSHFSRPPATKRCPDTSVKTPAKHHNRTLRTLGGTDGRCYLIMHKERSSARLGKGARALKRSTSRAGLSPVLSCVCVCARLTLRSLLLLLRAPTPPGPGHMCNLMFIQTPDPAPWRRLGKMSTGRVRRAQKGRRRQWRRRRRLERACAPKSAPKTEQCETHTHTQTPNPRRLPYRWRLGSVIMLMRECVCVCAGAYEWRRRLMWAV